MEWELAVTVRSLANHNLITEFVCRYTDEDEAMQAFNRARPGHYNEPMYPFKMYDRAGIFAEFEEDGVNVYIELRDCE